MHNFKINPPVHADMADTPSHLQWV